MMFRYPNVGYPDTKRPLFLDLQGHFRRSAPMRYRRPLIRNPQQLLSDVSCQRRIKVVVFSWGCKREDFEARTSLDLAFWRLTPSSLGVTCFAWRWFGFTDANALQCQLPTLHGIMASTIIKAIILALLLIV